MTTRVYLLDSRWQPLEEDRSCLCSAKHAWAFSSLNDGGFTNISGGGECGLMLCKLVFTSVTQVSGSCSADKPWTGCSYLRGQERGPKAILLQGVLQVSLELGTSTSWGR